MRTMLEANQEREVIVKVAVYSLTRNECPSAFKPRTCNICLLISYAREAGTRNRATGTWNLET